METATKLERPEVLDLLKQISSQEHHFNQLEADYRKLASQWLLATFAGVGFVLKADQINLPLGKDLFITLILLAGSVGIFLLWLLDIRVYHPLLHAAFKTGVALETEYSWLPKVRSAMVDSTKTGDVTNVVVFYYNVMVVVLVSLAGASLSHWLFGRWGWQGELSAICMLVFLFLGFGVFYYMRKLSQPETK